MRCSKPDRDSEYTVDFESDEGRKVRFRRNMNVVIAPSNSVSQGRSRMAGGRAALRLSDWASALVLSVIMVFGATVARGQEVENPAEVAGFRGVVEGKVKSAQEDGRAFVLAVSRAEFDPKGSTLKNNAPLVGKELRIGVRMPKKDGQPYPHPSDVEYLKGLKPGMTISVKVFSVHDKPRVVRIQEPGRTVGEPPKE
jgi:hypothetical protein